MPRQNVYMKQKTIDGIRQIVDARRNEGATASDANISSVCSEMLELGMRVYLNAQSKNNSEINETAEERFNKELIGEVVKSRIVSQQIFKLMFDLQDIRADSRNNYESLVNWMKEQAETRVAAVFNSTE